MGSAGLVGFPDFAFFDGVDLMTLHHLVFFVHVCVSVREDRDL